MREFSLSSRYKNDNEIEQTDRIRMTRDDTFYMLKLINLERGDKGECFYPAYWQAIDLANINPYPLIFLTNTPLPFRRIPGGGVQPAG